MWRADRAIVLGLALAAGGAGAAGPTRDQVATSCAQPMSLILFPSGSVRGTSGPSYGLDDAVAYVRGRRGDFTRIDVVGHTDRVGSEAANQALGLQRALAVAQALIADGEPSATIFIASRGELEPLVPTADGVREPQNRRVEITLNTECG